MAAIAAETRRGARASGDVVSGALLASGAAALFVGTLFYARLTPELGLPALTGRTYASAGRRAQARAASRWPSPAASRSSAIVCCSRRASLLASRSSGAGDLDQGWLGVDGGQRRARHGVRFDDRGAVLSLGARIRLRAVRSDQVVVRLSVRRRQRSLRARLDRCSVRGPRSQRRRCCRGPCRMSGSRSELRRRSAGSDMRLASCICRLSSASA